MRRIITVSLCTVAIAAGLSACNNGDYTATPNKDYSSTMNPFDPSIQHNVLIGTMHGMIDNKTYDLRGYYSVDENNIRTIYAKVINDSAYSRTIIISANNDEFKGKSQEAMPQDVPISYSYYDSTLKINRVYQSINSFTTSKIFVYKDADNKIWANVSGKLIREKPEPTDANDSASINLDFYLEKK